MKNTNNAIINNVLTSTKGFIKIDFDPKTTGNVSDVLVANYLI